MGDPASSAALHTEMPALAAAKASLSAALSEVAAIHHKLSGCLPTPVVRNGDVAVSLPARSLASSWKSGKRSIDAVVDAHNHAGVGGLVDSMYGIEVADVKMLLASAKSTIVSVRDALR